MRECITFTAQIANLTHHTGELLFVPFGKPTMFGGIGRDSLDIGNELFITLPGFRKRRLGAPLCVTGLLGLQHDALLDALKPDRRLFDLCPQGRFMFGVGRSQRFEFTEMGRTHVAQRLFRLRADGVPFGRGSFGQPEGGVTSGLGLRVLSKHCSKACLLVVKLAANGAHFALKFRPGGLESPGACDGCRRFRFQFVAALRKDPFALLDRKRPHRQHRIGNRRRQCRGECVVARLLVLPQLQFVIDRGAAALADFRVDQVDGEFMREPA